MATPAAESPVLPLAGGRGKRRRDAFSLLHLLTETDRFLTLARELAANPRRRVNLGCDSMLWQDTVGADLVLRSRRQRSLRPYASRRVRGGENELKRNEQERPCSICPS